MLRASLLLVLYLVSSRVPAAHAVQFGRCDVNVGSALIGVASAGLDDAGRPVLLVLQGGTSSRVIRVSIDPPTLQQSCSLAISTINLAIGTFQPQAMAVGDVDGDRRLDFVLAGSDGVAGHDLLVYLGSEDAQFSQHPTAPFRQTRDGTNAVAIADVDRDGVVDLISGSGADSSVSVLYSGTVLSNPVTVQGVSPANLAVAFLNDDGLPDIATGSSGTGSLSVLFQNPARTFLPSSSPSTVAVRNLVVADLNRDLVGDSLVTHNSLSRLDVYRGPLPTDLDAIGSPSQSLETGSGPTGIGVGDFTGDSEIDVVVANQDASSVSLYVGDGQGTLAIDPSLAGCRSQAGSARCAVGSRPTAVLAADGTGGVLDLDGDGIGDIVVANADDGTLSLLLSGPSSGNPTPTRSPSPSVPPSSTSTRTPTVTATPTATILTTDCCLSHSSPSCEPNREGQAACASCVCANDPHCCSDPWDDICVGFATTSCETACACTAPTFTPTEVLSPTPTATPTVSSTSTASPTPSVTPSFNPSNTPAPPSTRTPTATRTGTLPTVTRTPSRTPLPSNTPTPTATFTVRACSGGLCVNGESCHLDAGADTPSLMMITLAFALALLLARRSA